MIDFNPYNYENYFKRCTSRDEYGNANINGVNMSFLLALPYEEMVLVTQALNRLADFEDAEIEMDKREEQNSE